LFLTQSGCDSLLLHWSLDVAPQLELEILAEDSINPYLDYPIEAYLNSSVAQVTWSPGEGLSCDDCLSPVVNISRDKSYVVDIVDEYGCQIEASLDFHVDPIIDFYAPNIIMQHAPNNPINEFFFLHVNPEYKFLYNLSVFDRWGNKVFHKERITTNVADDGWVPNDNMVGVYVYYIEVLADIMPREIFGDVTVVR